MVDLLLAVTQVSCLSVLPVNVEQLKHSNSSLDLSGGKSGLPSSLDDINCGVNN